MTQYAEGIGGTYTPTPYVEDGPTDRAEKIITRLVGGRRVTVVIREDVAPVDPLLLLVKAALYTRVDRSSPFPVPPTSRTIKEALMRSVP